MSTIFLILSTGLFNFSGVTSYAATCRVDTTRHCCSNGGRIAQQDGGGQVSSWQWHERLCTKQKLHLHLTAVHLWDLMRKILVELAHLRHANHKSCKIHSCRFFSTGKLAIRGVLLKSIYTALRRIAYFENFCHLSWPFRASALKSSGNLLYTGKKLQSLIELLC